MSLSKTSIKLINIFEKRVNFIDKIIKFNLNY